jgi:hypothetical protein
MKDWIENHKLVRRLTLGWALWLITVVILRVTDPEVMEHVNGPMATIVTGVIGILATIIGFYMKLRGKDDDRPCNDGS